MEAPYKVKAKTLKAITKLIFNYQHGIDEHGFSTCPLCLVHLDSASNCKKCPNYVFYSENELGLACSQRANNYNLNYYNPQHNENLIKFWKEVKSFLKLRPAASITGMSEGTVNGILEIAEKYKIN